MKNSDIFIFIPVSEKRIDVIESNNILILNYINTLKEISEYECNFNFANTIKRLIIGNMQIAYMSDEYNNVEGMEWIEAYCCYTHQEISSLGILQIFIPGCQKEDSQIADIVSSGQLRIKFNSREFKVEEYVNSIGLSLSGKIRVLYCNSIEKKRDTDTGYLLAGETSCSEHIEYRIREENIKSIINKNISKYDFYELYASQNGLVFFLKKFSNDFFSNIKMEALIIYICEVAILQNTAISRINKQIVDELMQNSNISSLKTLKLQVEFGKTILLWDNNIYNYYMAQELSNDIVKIFGIDRLLEEYNRNSKHVKEIATLKNGISSEIEGKILNILAFILSITQLMPIVKNIIYYINGYPIHFGVSGTVIFLFIIMVITYKKRKNR